MSKRQICRSSSALNCVNGVCSGLETICNSVVDNCQIREEVNRRSMVRPVTKPGPRNLKIYIGRPQKYTLPAVYCRLPLTFSGRTIYRTASATRPCPIRWDMLHVQNSNPNVCLSYTIIPQGRVQVYTRLPPIDATLPTQNTNGYCWRICRWPPEPRVALGRDHQVPSAVLVRVGPFEQHLRRVTEAGY